MPVIFAISGNAGAAGVVVALTGANTASTTSAADGTYSFSGLSAGAYTLTPTLAGVTFTPTTLSGVIAGSITGANFVAQPTSFVSTPQVSDNFTRADAPNLGPNWTVITGNVDLIIASDAATPDSSLDGADIYTGENFSPNQKASMTVGAAAGNFELLVRSDITFATGYLASLNGSGPGTVALLDAANGFATIGVPVTLAAPNPGDILSVQAVGTLITAFYNGIPVISGTSTTTATGSPVLTIQGGAASGDTTVTLFTAGAEVFSISGSCGATGAGATVKLSGAASASTTAAAVTGDYSFAGLAPGTYYVTPGLTGHAFSPTSATVVITVADVTGVNFTLFTPSRSGSNSAGSMASGPLFATEIFSPSTSIIGTNLGTKILH